MIKKTKLARSNQFKNARLILFVAAFAAVGGYLLFSGFAGAPQPGASTAVCNPNPCTQGTAVSQTINVDDGGGKTVTRTYYIERPNGLTDSPSNLAPLVVLFAQPGGVPEMESQSAADNYVVLLIPNVHNPCTSGCQYAAEATNPDPASVGDTSCGSSGTSPCDDGPWVQAVLAKIDCVGAAPCENIDPNKVYAVGGSKGGTMTEDVMCDRRTNPYFTGFVPVSADLISPSLSDDPSASPYCPALLGTSNGYGGAVGQPPMKNFSVQWMLGDHDFLYNACPATTDCLELSWGPDGKGRWNFADKQLVGDNSYPNRTIGGALGCSGTPNTFDLLGSTKIIENDYGSCATTGRMVSYIKVVGGNHSYNGLDGISPMDAEAQTWAFLAQYGGAGSGGGGNPIGDINGDGKVDITDLSILLSHFGGPGSASQGDINGDGKVDVADLSILLSNFGT